MVTVTQRPPGCIKVSSLACSPVLLYAASCGCCFQTEVQVAECICIQVLLLLLLQAAAAQAFCCCCSDRLPLLLLRGWAWPLSMLRCTGRSSEGICCFKFCCMLQPLLLESQLPQSPAGLQLMLDLLIIYTTAVPGRAQAALTVTRRPQCLNLKIQVVLLLRLLLLRFAAAACSMHLHSAHSAQSLLCGR